jgi:hypothetical protein
MRRSLVLGDESARHPFRQSLPPHVRAGQGECAAPMRITAQDMRDFLLAFCACFLAVSAFIA